MKTRLIFAIALVLSSASSTTFAPPVTFSDADLPGVSKGKTLTYWVGPYVQISKGFAGDVATWFTEEGRIKRQTAVSYINPGFLITPGRQGSYLGVNEDWEIPLPNNPEPPGMSGYVDSTPDSSTFIHESRPKPGWFRADVYVHDYLTDNEFVEIDFEDIHLRKNGWQ